MPSIQVTGQLVDPTTGVEGSADIRIASVINYGQTTKKSISHKSTDASGNYDFQLVYGKHLIFVKYEDERIYIPIGYAVVGDSTPDPIDLIQLINLSDENPPSELVTELQKLREDTLNDIVSTSAEVLENAGYKGLWPDTGGSALKGETWQTQIGGVPTGDYYIALQDTNAEPVDDNVNWRLTSINKNSLADYAELSFDTVSSLQSGKTIGGGHVVLKEGDFVRIYERDNGLFKITTDTSNGFDKIDTTTGLSAVYADPCEISDIAFGLKNDGSDENVAIQAFFNTTHETLRLKGVPGAGSYLSSKSIVTGENKTIYWNKNKYLESIGGVDQGHVILFSDGCVVYSPKVDGGGPSLITGGSGQNGIGFEGTVLVYNSKSRNCARGTSAPYDGGKGVQSESHAGGDVTIFNHESENCHMASSSRKDETTGTGNKLQIFGLKAVNCNSVNFSGMANINSTDPKDFEVKIYGVEAIDCGGLDSLPSADMGLFVGNRAANVVISGVTISGTTKLQGACRGRFRNSSIEIESLQQPLLSYVNIDPDPLYAPDTTLSENMRWKIKSQSNADYILYSDITDATFANRFVSNSELHTELANDVLVRTVTPATRNGNCILISRLGEKVIDARASIYNAEYLKINDALAGTTIGQSAKIGSPVNEGIDQSQSLGIIVDGTVRTLNASSTANPYFGPTSDDIVSCGWFNARWKEFFSTNATINTSDETMKLIDEIPQEWFAAALKMESIRFKWLSEIEKHKNGERGEPRWHIGYGAQSVYQALIDSGVENPFECSFLCRDILKEEDEKGDLVPILDEDTGEPVFRWGVRLSELNALRVEACIRK